MRREYCGGCGGTDLVEFLDLGTSPLADKFPAYRMLGQRRYPLGLARCALCTLVQLTEIVPDAELWTDDYGFYSSASSVNVDYFQKYAMELMANYGRLAKRFTVEVACNDGVLLRPLKEADRKSVV